MLKEPERVEMETQTPADIAADAVPWSLSQRPFPQGATNIFWKLYISGPVGPADSALKMSVSKSERAHKHYNGIMKSKDTTC